MNPTHFDPQAHGGLIANGDEDRGKQPAPGKMLLPVLAEMIPRGDGTFLLRPHVPVAGLDTWLTIRQTAEVLSVRPRTVYDLLDEYLVYRRALPTRILVSLESALALRHATQDPEFWQTESLQMRIKTRVREVMEELIAEAAPK